MPSYDFKCEDCGHLEEYFASFAEWDEARTNGTNLFPKKCPKCGSENFRRQYGANIFTATSPEQRQENLQKVIAEDTQKIANGDMDFIKNIAGDKPINQNPGQRYMKDVKKGVFKRK